MKTTATKAIVAGGLALAAALGYACSDGVVSASELVEAAGTGLVTFAGTWAASNKTVLPKQEAAAGGPPHGEVPGGGCA